MLGDQISKEKQLNQRPTVKQMPLEPEEACCVCYTEMTEDDNLSFCKFGCGRNIHTECMERWVKHKIQNAQKVTCPLCREDWGKNVLDELK